MLAASSAHAFAEMIWQREGEIAGNLRDHVTSITCGRSQLVALEADSVVDLGKRRAASEEIRVRVRAK